MANPWTIQRLTNALSREDISIHDVTLLTKVDRHELYIQLLSKPGDKTIQSPSSSVLNKLDHFIDMFSTATELSNSINTHTLFQRLASRLALPDVTAPSTLDSVTLEEAEDVCDPLPAISFPLHDESDDLDKNNVELFAGHHPREIRRQQSTTFLRRRQPSSSSFYTMGDVSSKVPANSTEEQLKKKATFKSSSNNPTVVVSHHLKPSTTPVQSSLPPTSSHIATTTSTATTTTTTAVASANVIKRYRPIGKKKYSSWKQIEKKRHSTPAEPKPIPSELSSTPVTPMGAVPGTVAARVNAFSNASFPASSSSGHSGNWFKSYEPSREEGDNVLTSTTFSSSIPSLRSVRGLSQSLSKSLIRETLKASPQHSHESIFDASKDDSKPQPILVSATVEPISMMETIPKESTCPFAGIYNQGTTCYLNALIQMFFHLIPLRKLIYHTPQEDAIHPSIIATLLSSPHAVVRALQILFATLQLGETGNTATLTKTFGWSSDDLHVQHDSHELIKKLLDVLEKDLGEASIRELFCGTREYYTKCLDVPKVSKRREHFYDLELLVRGVGSLQESLAAETRTERLDGENQYCWERDDEDSERDGPKGSKSYHVADRGVRYQTLPPVLLVHPVRVEFCLKTLRNLAIESSWIFSEIEDFTPLIQVNKHRHCTDELHSRKKSSLDSSYRYRLKAMVIHTGPDSASGHYYTYVNIDGKGWVCFNDAHVNKARTRHMWREAFSETRITRATMLLYIKEGDVRFNDGNASSCQIPKNILRRVDQEREDRERRGDKALLPCWFVRVHDSESAGLALAAMEGGSRFLEPTSPREPELSIMEAFGLPSSTQCWLLARDTKRIHKSTLVGESLNSSVVGMTVNKSSNIQSQLKPDVACYVRYPHQLNVKDLWSHQITTNNIITATTTSRSNESFKLPQTSPILLIAIDQSMLIDTTSLRKHHSSHKQSLFFLHSFKPTCQTFVPTHCATSLKGIHSCLSAKSKKDSSSTESWCAMGVMDGQLEVAFTAADLLDSQMLFVPQVQRRHFLVICPRSLVLQVSMCYQQQFGTVPIRVCQLYGWQGGLPILKRNHHHPNTDIWSNSVQSLPLSTTPLDALRRLGQVHHSSRISTVDERKDEPCKMVVYSIQCSPSQSLLSSHRYHHPFIKPLGLTTLEPSLATVKESIAMDQSPHHPPTTMITRSNTLGKWLGISHNDLVRLFARVCLQGGTPNQYPLHHQPLLCLEWISSQQCESYRIHSSLLPSFTTSLFCVSLTSSFTFTETTILLPRNFQGKLTHIPQHLINMFRTSRDVPSLLLQCSSSSSSSASLLGRHTSITILGKNRSEDSNPSIPSSLQHHSRREGGMCYSSLALVPCPKQSDIHLILIFLTDEQQNVTSRMHPFPLWISEEETIHQLQRRIVKKRREYKHTGETRKEGDDWMFFDNGFLRTLHRRQSIMRQVREQWRQEEGEDKLSNRIELCWMNCSSCLTDSSFRNEWQQLKGISMEKKNKELIIHP